MILMRCQLGVSGTRAGEAEFGFQFSRLQIPHPSTIPTDFRPELLYSERLKQYASPLLTELSWLFGRVFFITEDGHMGVAPRGIRQDDKVVILLGGDMPLILWDRKKKGDPLQFIREAYVHGVMNGEVVGTIPSGDKIE
jgi:hypothetical protein